MFRFLGSVLNRYWLPLRTTALVVLEQINSYAALSVLMCGSSFVLYT
jgi:hypothetical protein